MFYIPGAKPVITHWQVAAEGEGGNVSVARGGSLEQALGCELTCGGCAG